jgi:hypothetical protein
MIVEAFAEGALGLGYTTDESGSQRVHLPSAGVFRARRVSSSVSFLMCSEFFCLPRLQGGNFFSELVPFGDCVRSIFQTVDKEIASGAANW